MLPVHLTINTTPEEFSNIRLKKRIRDRILTNLKMLEAILPDAHLYILALEFLGREFKNFSVWRQSGDPGDPGKERRVLFYGSPADILNKNRWIEIVSKIPRQY